MIKVLYCVLSVELTCLGIGGYLTQSLAWDVQIIQNRDRKCGHKNNHVFEPSECLGSSPSGQGLFRYLLYHSLFVSFMRSMRYFEAFLSIAAILSPEANNYVPGRWVPLFIVCTTN